MIRWLSGPSRSSVRRHREARLRSCLTAGITSFAAFFLEGDAVRAQDDAAGPTTEISNTGEAPTNAGGLPNDFFRNDPALGMRYREFFRNTGSPFRDSGQPELDAPLTASVQEGIRYDGDLANFNTNFNVRQPVPLSGTESIRTSMDLMFLRLDYGLGASHGSNLLGYGFEPQDADLKVGPLFFKLRAISSSLLMSDNVEASETDREAGAIAIAQLSGSVVAQLTDNLRLRMGGGLYWLPFKGKVGISTDSGAFDFNFGDTGGRAPVAQIDWDGRIGGWDVFLLDSFYANVTGDLLGGFTFDQGLFEGAGFNEFDRAGRYAYGGYGARPISDEAITRTGDTSDYDLTSYGNRLDVGAQRLLPGPVRLRIRAYREDLWYNQGTRGRPSIREGASIFAGSERENMRFKPYVRYDVDHSNSEPEWDQLIVAGIRGPITDQLFMNFYAGEFIDGPTDATEFVAGLNLTHIAGPYTYESLFIGREVDNTFDRTQLVDHITYDIHQVLGPKIFADGIASYRTTRTVDDSGDERDEFLAGIQVSIIPGPRTRVRLSYSYDRITTSNPDFLFSGEDRFDDGDVTGESIYISQTARIGVTYNFTDTFLGRLSYVYRNVESTVENRSYYENLVIITLTKSLY